MFCFWLHVVCLIACPLSDYMLYLWIHILWMLTSSLFNFMFSVWLQNLCLILYCGSDCIFCLMAFCSLTSCTLSEYVFHFWLFVFSLITCYLYNSMIFIWLHILIKLHVLCLITFIFSIWSFVFFFFITCSITCYKSPTWLHDMCVSAWPVCLI